MPRSEIRRLTEGDTPFYEPGLKEMLKANRDAGRISFTTDIAVAVKQNCAFYFIAVGTPARRGDGLDYDEEWYDEVTAAGSAVEREGEVRGLVAPQDDGLRLLVAVGAEGHDVFSERQVLEGGRREAELLAVEQELRRIGARDVDGERAHFAVEDAFDQRRDDLLDVREVALYGGVADLADETALGEIEHADREQVHVLGGLHRQLLSPGDIMASLYELVTGIGSVPPEVMALTATAPQHEQVGPTSQAAMAALPVGWASVAFRPRFLMSAQQRGWR